MARLIASSPLSPYLKSSSVSRPSLRLHGLPFPHRIITDSKSGTPVTDNRGLKRSFNASSLVTVSPLFQCNGGNLLRDDSFHLMSLFMRHLPKHDVTIRCYCSPVHNRRIKGHGHKLGVRHPDTSLHDSNAIAIRKELLAERKRVADLMKAGIDTLLKGDSNILLDNQTVLCVQVILRVPRGKFQNKVAEIERDILCTESPLHKLEVEVATLLHYAANWIQGCSMVIGELNDLHKRVLSSNLEGGIAKGSQSTANYTEVMVFVISDFETEEDKDICNRDQLKFFLKRLIKEKQIRRVHVTRSSVEVREGYLENYTHLSIGT